MKSKEFMTENPIFCLPVDTAGSVAQLMKDEDIGAVPVVSDPDERILIGLVTDRDLAVRVDASGFDPDATLVGEVMTRDLATCMAEDECQKVLDVMTARQVRRVPIVDADGRLVGIIAQADVARCVENPEEVARVLKDISRLAGTEVEEMPRRRVGMMKYCGPALLAAGGIGVGAAAMYLLDPARGRGRRQKLLGRAESAYTHSGQLVGRIGEDVANRVSGLVAEAKSAWRHEPVSDEKLLDRVRARLGHVTRHPHAIEVKTHTGRVILSGPILAKEVDRVLHAVKKIPGVVRVESHLEKHVSDASFAKSQSKTPSKSRSFNWAPWLQFVGTVALGLLARRPTKATATVSSTEPRSKSQAA